jgi:hypothetical protein
MDAVVLEIAKEKFEFLWVVPSGTTKTLLLQGFNP